MKKRPLLLIIVSLLHLLEPLFKLLQYRLQTDTPLLEVVTTLFSISGPRQIFEFWLLFPLAGCALLLVKTWSWVLFILLQVYSIYVHLYFLGPNWPYISNMPFFSSWFLLALNGGLIIFLLLPSMRAPFFDRRMRWWEHKTRYNFRFPCTLIVDNPNILHDCTIHNISLSGAFIDYGDIVADNQAVVVNITFKNRYISLNAVKISTHAFGGTKGIGVKFSYRNLFEQFKMSRMIREIASHSKRGPSLSEVHL